MEPDSPEQQSCRDLPAHALIEANVLGVPSFALSNKTAKGLSQIIYEWPGPNVTAKFTFSRTGDTPFPEPTHSRYLDILMSLFASNFRPDGLLHFRMSDVLRIAGNHPNSGGARASLREAIQRYMRCHAEWSNSFRLQGRAESWTGSFITYCNLWDEKGDSARTNPRQSGSDEDLHIIQFHPLIVKSIEQGHFRKVLTSIFKANLPPTAYCVFRYFRRFSDSGEVGRSLDHLKRGLNYQDRDARFKDWLERQLQILEERRLVESFVFSGSSVTVKLTSTRDLQKQDAIEELMADA